MSTPESESSSAPPPLSPATRRRLLLGGLCLLAVGFGIWGLWRVFEPPPDDARTRLARYEAQQHEQQSLIDELRQRVATLKRSDQISRDANGDLQHTLAERDEQIAALRADVDFYERFVGATAQRHGLSVHELALESAGALGWHFTVTLTQNINRGAVNDGELTLALEGTRNGRLQQLDWSELRQQPDATGIDYSFRYFQQVEGDIVLPPGLEPLRVTVRLQPDNGKPVEQSFTWDEVTRQAAVTRPPQAAADDA